MADLAAVQAAPRFMGGRRIGRWDRAIPEPAHGELLIRVRANAICGTDAQQFDQGAEVVPGHEIAGVVEAAAPGSSTAIGAPGVVYLMDFCGECRHCLLGYTNQCAAKRGDVGFTRDGGYGAYVLVHQSQFFEIGADDDLAVATLLLDVMGTTGHALARAAAVRPDIGSIAVAGAGPIGAGVVVMARIVLGDAVRIVVSDVVPERLAFIEQLGGVPVDVGRSSLADGLRAAGIREGADAAIDTSGRSAARHELVAALGRRGVLVCVGHGEDLRLDVSPDLIAPERSVLGSEYFRYGELPANLRRLRESHSDLAPIVTARYPTKDLPRALSRFFGGAAGKIVVVRD